MARLKDVLTCFGIGYTIIAWVLGITVGSIMVHIHNTGDWKNSLEESITGESIASSILFKSWQKVPYVDVFPTLERSCPLDFPDDLIYDIWPGSRGYCDCM